MACQTMRPVSPTAILAVSNASLSSAAHFDSSTTDNSRRLPLPGCRRLRYVVLHTIQRKQRQQYIYCCMDTRIACSKGGHRCIPRGLCYVTLIVMDGLALKGFGRGVTLYVLCVLSSKSRFVGLMEKHGFVVLTEVGAIRETYLKFMQLLKAFFDGDSERKEACKGGVHFNERGIPMVRAFKECPSGLPVM